MSTILVGSSIPAFAMDTPHWGHWLTNAEQISERALEAGHDVDWLAVLQYDSRGRGRFSELLEQVGELGGGVRWFSLDPPASEWDSGSRIGAICAARNLIIEDALATGHEWIYFADSDIEAPDDILERLLELDWPVCGAHVPTYCLDGPRVQFIEGRTLGRRHVWNGGDEGEGWDVRRHWNTAGSLLMARECFRRVPWRHDPDAGHTDDPATQAELARLGWPTLVRHDVTCTHHPAQIGPLEERGLDLRAYRLER